MKTANVREGANSMLAFDVERVRADFPILHQEIYGQPLARAIDELKNSASNTASPAMAGPLFRRTPTDCTIRSPALC